MRGLLDGVVLKAMPLVLTAPLVLMVPLKLTVLPLSTVTVRPKELSGFAGTDDLGSPLVSL